MNESLLTELNRNIKALLSLMADLLKELRAANKKWLNYREAADYLGYPVSTLYSKTCNREIPSYGRGRNKRFNRDELDRMLQKQKVKRLEIEP